MCRFFTAVIVVLVLGSCATRQEVPIKYMNPSLNKEKFIDHQKIVILPVSIMDEKDSVVPDTLEGVVKNIGSFSKWNNLTLKKYLDDFNIEQISYMKKNPFVEVEDISALGEDNSEILKSFENKLVVVTTITHFYSRLFDESYVSSTKLNVGNYRSYFEGQLVSNVFDGNTGKILYSIGVKETMNDSLKDYNEALLLPGKQGKVLVHKGILKVEQQLAPYLVSETRPLIIPQTESDVFRNGRLLAKKHEYKMAAELFKEYWTSEKMPEAGYNLALIYEVLGQYDLAKSVLTTLAEQGFAPAQKELSFVLGLDLELQKRMVK